MILTKEQIMEIIPHRCPMLMVDEIVEMDIDAGTVVGKKTFTGQEVFFSGHFPGNPVVPAVFTLEALAQAGAVALLSRPEFRGKTGYYAAIDKAKFREKILPGDTMMLEVKLVKLRGSIGIAEGVASVNGKKAAQAVMTFAIGD